MNITNHAKLRYVQRIIGIDNEQDAKQHLVEHGEAVQNDAIEMFGQAEHVWSGCTTDKRPANFYIHDDVVFVTDEPNTAIITIYRCNFGFPDNVNKLTINSMMNEIWKLRKKEQKQEEQIADERDKKNAELDAIQMQVNATEKQLSLLQDKRDLMQKELEALNYAPMFTRQEIAKIAAPIVNSVDFRVDVLGMKRNA